MWKGGITLLVVLVVIVGLGLVAIAGGWLGRHEGPGELTEQPIPPALVAARTALQSSMARGLGIAEPKQILFGDLHVHTTVSSDAFLFSLPMLSGEGAHPQGDACDFARYCAALDFWSITDHAESLTQRRWRETIESVRQCNAVAGDAANPDVVSYLGWEWTQVGATPEAHYGHKNVIFRGTDDSAIPARPIGSRYDRGLPPLLRVGLAFLDPSLRALDLGRYSRETAGEEMCPEGVPVRELADDCREVAPTPGVLFEKLADWGHDSIVIPHGTAWGWTAPLGASFDHQLTSEQHDPDRQTLGSRLDLGGHGAQGGLRNQRRPYTALVRSAESAGRRTRTDGIRGDPAGAAAVSRARRRRARAEARLPGLRQLGALPRAPAQPVSRGVLSPLGSAQAHHAHRGRAHPPPDAPG
jgi:hypothetical protein